MFATLFDFAGGGLSSDLGTMLLRGVDLQIGFTRRLAAALPDRRHQRYINHSYHDILTQRIYQIACGYEDGNDANSLRHDPMFKFGAPLSASRNVRQCNEQAHQSQEPPDSARKRFSDAARLNLPRFSTCRLLAIVRRKFAKMRYSYQMSR
jgi:hypothetical protein